MLALLCLTALAGTSFGATWFLQGTGSFDNTNTWRMGSNAGAKGVPASIDSLKFYDGGAPDPMPGADATITLNANQAVTVWDQKYGNATVRLNLNGRNLTVTNAITSPSFHLMEGNTGNKAYVSGGGTLATHGLRAVGYKAGGFFLSGASTRLKFIGGDFGLVLGGGYNSAEEVRFEVTGGALARNDLAWSSSQVGMGSGIAGRGYATVYLSDTNTQMLLTGSGTFTVGVQGRGQLIVTNGASFYSADAVNLGGYMYDTIAYDGTLGHGTIRVDGSGSSFEAAGMYVGMFSTGVVQVVRGGQLLGTDMVLGAGYFSAVPANGTNTAAYGTLTIANTNSRVDVESLKVGDLGRGEVAVSSNAVLAVLGPIALKNSKLTVSDAVVAASGPAGSLTTSGTTNTIRFELGGRDRVVQAAYIQAGGDVNLAAGTTLELVLLGNFSALINDQIKLIGCASRTGDFSNYPDQTVFTMGEYTFKITYARSGIYLMVTAAPAVPLPTLDFQRGVNGLTFSWSETGFKLQAQTNSAGLTTNWFDYPNGGTSPVTVPINPANPSVFFRLKDGLTIGDLLKNYVPAVYVYGPATMRSNVTQTVSGNSLIISAVVSNASTSLYGQFGGFLLPELTLGTAVSGYDFSGSGVLVPLSTANANEQLGSQYPRSYSPLLVVKSGDTLISFSFHYPILSYKHESKFAIKYAGGGKWQPTHLTTFFDYPTTPPSSYHRVGALFDPQLSRTYTMVITTGSTLAEVVAPYKAYFDSLYPGGKQYTPDLSPLMPIALAANNAPGYPTTNPYGWYPNFVSADTLGFEAVVKPEVLKYIRGGPGDYNLGNSNFMIWAPTGVVDGDLSYPFQFTTRWSAFTGGTTGTVAALKSLVTPGRRMGLWWGHSVDYQPNWNSAVGRAEFDSTNPTHRAFGHAQMTNAIAAGASFIGLDAFAHGLGRNPGTGATDGLNQLWYILPWIQELKATYPGVKFITEGMASDILHRETATYLDYWGWDYTKRLNGRHLLADILLPGSEIVTGIYYSAGQVVEPELWGGKPYWDASNEEARLNVIRTAIGYGYVPIPFYGGLSLDHDL